MLLLFFSSLFDGSIYLIDLASLGHCYEGGMHSDTLLYGPFVIRLDSSPKLLARSSPWKNFSMKHKFPTNVKAHLVLY